MLSASQNEGSQFFSACCHPCLCGKTVGRCQKGGRGRPRKKTCCHMLDCNRVASWAAYPWVQTPDILSISDRRLSTRRHKFLPPSLECRTSRGLSEIVRVISNLITALSPVTRMGSLCCHGNVDKTQAISATTFNSFHAGREFCRTGYGPAGTQLGTECWSYQAVCN